MRYWWVNQNQTYRHEVVGGYLWSPKRKSNGGINPFYESMREALQAILSSAGSEGPKQADELLARSGHCWRPLRDS